MSKKFEVPMLDGLELPPQGKKVCYLLHFDSILFKSTRVRHYLGTSKVFRYRMKKHATDPDAKVLQVAKALGIKFTVVALWDGYYEKEKELKRRRQHSHYCPICRAEEAAKKASKLA